VDVIIGRYRVRIEGNQLILTHEVGISFDLTPDEALGLRDFINVYRQALIDAQRDTEPRLERVLVEEQDEEDKQP